VPEQFVLTISENGYGKRTSSFEYRITGRGGKGIVAMAVNERNGKLIASFPVEDADQIMLVTDGGQMIRMPVGGDKPIRIVGRGSQGVIVFSGSAGCTGRDACSGISAGRLRKVLKMKTPASGERPASS
jgi:DNA gyrase subunit A